MRLFVALPVAEVATEALAGQLTELGPGWAWTDPGTWHVTLAFLGSVDGQRRPDVERVLADAVAGGPVELTVDEVATVARRMAWLHLGDRPPGAVARLGERVQTGLQRAQLPVDRREVVPHVTVARWRGEGRRAPAGQEPQLPELRAAWTADRVVLFRSHLGSDGARHEVLATWPLG